MTIGWWCSADPFRASDRLSAPTRLGRIALLGDLLEPVPRRRRRPARCRNQLSDGWVHGGPLSAFEPAVPFGHPPLGASGQRGEAPVVWGPPVGRVIRDVDGPELRIADGVELVGEPDGRLFWRSRLYQDPAVALQLHPALAHAELL